MTSAILPRRDHRGEDRRARLERALLRVHGGMLLTFTVVSLAPLASAGSWPLSQLLPRIAIAVVYVVVALDLQVRGERLEHIALLLVPFLAVSQLEVVPMASDVAAGLSVGALALSAARQLRPGGYLILMAPAGLAHVAARVVSGGDFDTALSDVVVGVGMTLAVYAFVESLYIALGRSADADKETSRQRSAALEESVQRRVVAAAGRALHDDVLVVLRLIASGDGERARIREMCGQAVRAVSDVEEALIATELGEEPSPGSTLTVQRLVWEVNRSTPVGFDVEVTGSDAQTVLPMASYHALRRALGEALRNVARHSGVTTAELEFDVTTTVLGARVIDHGTGMGESALPGYGMASSIRDAVAEVGGSAEVSETPGGGVTIAITLPLPRSQVRSVLQREYDLTVRAVGSARPILSITWPVAAVWVYTAIRFSPEWPNPAVSLFLAVLYVLASALILHRVTSRAPTLRWLVLAQLGLLALSAGSLALLPSGSLLDYRSWPMGFLAVPLVILLMVLPLRAAVWVEVPHVLLILGAVWVRPDLTDGAVPVATLNAVLATPIAAFVLGRLMRRIGRRIELEERQSAKLSTERAARNSMTAVGRLQLAHARTTVVPWLTAIADGEADPLARGARTQAQLLAAEIRDDLYAPGFVVGALQEEVVALRRRGGTFTVRPSEPIRASVDGIRGTVARVLSGLDGRQKVTVTLLHEAPGLVAGARVAIVPPAPPRAIDSLTGCMVQSDEYSTAIVVGTSGSREVSRRGELARDALVGQVITRE